MATYENTPNRNYQLPHPSNLLADDVSRLRSALNAIDADVHARPTQTAVTSQITTAVNNGITGLVDAAPAALDTLNELAAALGDDANFATTVTNGLAGKAPLASPALTGVPTAPTAAVGTSTTQIATTAFVNNEIANDVAGKADLASPTFTGTPAAPTAAADTNTTQLATTAFVVGQAGTSNPVVAGTASAGTSLRYARQDHVHPTDTSRAPLASPTFTGTPAAPTAAVDTNTTQLATTAYVVGQGYLKSSTASSTYAPLASPTLTGTPAAPTAAVDTNTTQIATTAYVVGQGYSKLASPTFTGTPAAPTAAVDTNTTQLATTAFVLAQAAGTAPVADGTAAIGTSTRYARQDHVHPTDTTRVAVTKTVNTQSSAYNIAAADAGRIIVTSAGVTTVTNTLAAGQSLEIWNNSGVGITLIQGASTTLYLAGNATAGSRTIAARGFCVVVCVQTNVYVAYGTGVS